MQLGDQADEFRKRGYGVAGLTYDSPAVLAYFRDRMGLHYTLLSDPESKVIRAFGILNTEIPKGHEWYGVPYPGIYVINAQGIVKAKFFEESVIERYTAGSALNYIDSSEGMISGRAETDHLKLTLSASDYDVRPGNRVTLELRVELKPGLHVYAPGVAGSYKPLKWTLKRSRGWRTHPVRFPEPETLSLPAIRESLPVYEGTVFLFRDITVSQLQELASVVTPAGDLFVKGTLRYQACDDKECFPPEQVPLKWNLHGKLHDQQRVPEELRR